MDIKGGNGRRIQDLTGNVYNRWTVLKFSHLSKGSWWICECSCGTIRTVSRGGFIKGNSKSCGCLTRENSSIKNTLKDGEAAFNKTFNSYYQHAKLKSRKFEISKEEFKILTKMHCHYCGSAPSNITKKNESLFASDYIYNGIDRKDNNEGYTVKNCVPCCKICNQAKHTFSYAEFMNWIQVLISYRTTT